MAEVSAIIALIISIGSVVYAKNAIPDDSSGVSLTKQGSQSPRNIIYGTTTTSCTKVWTNVLDRDKSNRTDVFSVGGIGPLIFHNAWIRDKQMFIEDKNFVSDPTLESDGIFSSRSSEGWMNFEFGGGFLQSTVKVQFRSGHENQVASKLAKDYSDGEWTDDHKGALVPHIVVTADYSDDSESAIIGDQYNIFCKVSRPNDLYDPRTALFDGDSSNPALAILDYITSKYYGLGIPVEYLNMDSFVTAANICDMEGFEIHTEVNCSETFGDILNKMLAICMGSLTFKDGKLQLLIETIQPAPIYNFNENNILENSLSVKTTSSSEYCNVVSSKYKSIKNRYEYDDCVIPANASDLLINADDYPGSVDAQRLKRDGELITKSLDLGYTASAALEGPGYNVTKITTREFRRAEFQKECSFDVDLLDYPELDIWSVVSVTLPLYGWNNKKFRVQSMITSTDATKFNVATVTLREYDDSIYTNTLDSVIGKPSKPDVVVHSPSEFTFTMSSYTDSGQGVLTWNPNFFTKTVLYDIEYKLSSQSSWTNLVQDFRRTEYVVINLKLDRYDFRVRARDPFHGSSDWTVINDIDISSPYTIPDITSHSTTFSGNDIFLYWEDVTGVEISNVTEASNPNAANSSGTFADVFSHYELKVFKGDVLQSTHKVNVDYFNYSLELNNESPAGVSRNVKFEVVAVDKIGSKSINPRVINVTNPQILVAEGLKVTNRNGLSKLEWDKPSDLDFDGTVVHISKTSGFTPDGTTVHTILGPETQFTFAYPEDDTDDHYVKIAHFDVFGMDDLTYSPQQTFSYVGGAKSAQLIQLSTSSQIFKEDDAGLLSPSSITIEANKQNLPNSINWTTNPSIPFTNNDDNIVITTDNFGTNESVEVTAQAGTYTDKITIFRISDGSDGNPGSPGEPGTSGVDSLFVIIDNESHTIPTATDGTGGIYTGSGTKVFVYEGTDTLTYDGVANSNGTYKVTTTGENITVGSISNSSGVASIGNHSNMTQDVAKVTITIIGKRQDGTPFSIIRYQSLSKSRGGSDGRSGAGFYSVAIRGNNANGTNYSQAQIDSLFSDATDGKEKQEGDFISFTLEPAKAYRCESGAWVPVSNYFHGSMIVEKSLGAAEIVVDDLFSENVHVTNQVIVGANKNSGRRVELSGDPSSDSPFNIYHNDTRLLSFTTGSSTELDGSGGGDIVLNMKGELGKNTIRTISAFSPDIWDKIQTKIPGSTGGAVSNDSINHAITGTSPNGLGVLTQSNGNSSTMTISITVIDDESYSSTTLQDPVYTDPVYEVSVYRGTSTSGTFVGKETLTGTSYNYGSQAGYVGGLSISATANIKDSGHGMNDEDEGQSVSYYATVKRLSTGSNSYNDPRVTSYVISQQTKAGEPIGLGSQNIWTATQTYKATSTNRFPVNISSRGADLGHLGIKFEGHSSQHGHLWGSHLDTDGSGAYNFNFGSTEPVTKLHVDGNKVIDARDTSATGGTSNVVERDSAGDVRCRLLRPTYTNQTTITGAIAYRVNNSGDNYLRFCSDKAAIRNFIDSPSKGGSGATGNWNINIYGNAATASSASSANTASYVTVRNATGSTHYNMLFHSGNGVYHSNHAGGAKYRPSDGETRFKQGYLANTYLRHHTDGSLEASNTNVRSAGIYGLYDSYRASQVWSMGRNYRIPNDGKPVGGKFGDLYGMVYFHTNSGIGTYAGGHQIALAENGQVNLSLGMSGQMWSRKGATFSQHLQVNSTITATGQVKGSSWRSTSALKYKDITERVDASKSLELVCKIGSKGTAVGTFKDPKKKDSDTHRWFIADEVNEFIPEVVGKSEDGSVDNLNYNEMLPDAYAAISKQQEIIEDQQRQIDELKQLVKELMYGS